MKRVVNKSRSTESNSAAERLADYRGEAGGGGGGGGSGSSLALGCGGLGGSPGSGSPENHESLLLVNDMPEAATAVVAELQASTSASVKDHIKVIFSYYSIFMETTFSSLIIFVCLDKLP